jgi:hypothetical protein
MKTLIGAALAAGLLAASGGLVTSGASAQSIHVGPRGGIHITPDGPRRHMRRHRGERCRTIVERRRNRFGEMVERRTRVCR